MVFPRRCLIIFPPVLQLNHKEFIDTLSLIPNVHVQSVALQDLSFRDQLLLLANTSVLIGVHGSGLVNVLFLPKGASAVEIFPYKIQRRSYEDLARIMGIRYSAWRNQDRSATKFHERILDTFALVGDARQKVIDNPVYTTWAANMYWINQDTRVNAEEITSLLTTESLESDLNLRIKVNRKAREESRRRKGGEAGEGEAPGDGSKDEL